VGKARLQRNKSPVRNYSVEKGQRKLAAFFVAPWVIGFLAFSLYPIILTCYYSFTEYNLFSTPKFVGLENYITMFSDGDFYKSLYNTVYFVVFGVGLNLIFSLLAAMLLNMDVKGRGFFRAVVFLPSVMPVVASSLLWVWIFNPEYGLINAFLRFLRLPQPLWFSSPQFTKPALIIMTLWGLGSTMVIFLAGLGDIPRVYYEAVDIDGGGAWNKFWHVTLPMLTPVILFQLINGIIGGFNMFTQTYVIANSSGSSGANLGGVDNSMLFYAVYVYEQGFKYLKYGYASALAWLMFLLVLVITFLIFKSSKKWVYYGGE
jgi:multiple sugar transport system permease protein